MPIYIYKPGDIRRFQHNFLLNFKIIKTIKNPKVKWTNLT